MIGINNMLKSNEEEAKEGTSEKEMTDDLSEKSDKTKKNKKAGNKGQIPLQAVIGAIAALIILALVGKLAAKEKNVEDSAKISTQTAVPTSSSENSSIQENSQSNSTPVPEVTTNSKYVSDDIPADHSETNYKIYNENEFIKDLDGNDIPVKHDFVKNEFIYRNVNYVTKRAIVDDGMELYWLDIDYLGKKYKAQINYYHYNKLDDVGICKVKIEVLYLEDGSVVITNMQVVDEDEVAVDE